MNCARCNKPESAHPVVPWFGMKCYGFQAPPKPAPRPPKPEPSGYVGPTIGIQGSKMRIAIVEHDTTLASMLGGPDALREFAREILAVADVLDPPGESPSGDGGGKEAR